MQEADFHFKQLDYSFIGKRSLLKGTLLFNGKTHIAGIVEGDLIIKEESIKEENVEDESDEIDLLTLEIESCVLGNIVAYDIDIYGTVEGKIKAHGKVTIYPTGSVNGEIEARELSIHPGATVNIKGHTTMPL